MTPEFTQLPLDVDVKYYPSFLSHAEAQALYEYLDEIEALKELSMRMADGSVRELETGRYFLVDEGLTGYDALPEVWGSRERWPGFIIPIKDRISEVAGCTFDVCRVIYLR